MQIKTKPEVYKQIKIMYPSIDWVLFEDLDRAINWELWNGPLGVEYWNREDGVEPLDKYDWVSFDKAVEDITELLDPLPSVLWLDDDDFIYTKNPEDDDGNYEQQSQCKNCDNYMHYDEEDHKWYDDDGDYCEYNDGDQHEPMHIEHVWIGPESYQEIDVRQYMMHDESWKQVF